ncbi:phosphohydrolase [Patescibacteria group bacterium]|nr:phosphohydrolase [Patescibacteria group bacterium]
MKKLDIQSATQLLHENMQNKNLRKHCYAVGKTLSEFYDFFMNEGREVGGLTKEQWEIVGILHDADWEKTTDNPDRHVFELLSWLEDYDIPEEMLNAFQTHNYKMTKIREPQTLLEWTLECCDELTGFIVAIALVMPNKKLSEVNTESIFKKFKQKEFAKAVEREQILQCKEKVGIVPEKFVEITLKAMQENSELLGL